MARAGACSPCRHRIEQNLLVQYLLIFFVTVDGGKEFKFCPICGTSAEKSDMEQEKGSMIAKE